MTTMWVLVALAKHLSIKVVVNLIIQNNLGMYMYIMSLNS